MSGNLIEVITLNCCVLVHAVVLKNGNLHDTYLSGGFFLFLIVFMFYSFYPTKKRQQNVIYLRATPLN